MPDDKVEDFLRFLRFEKRYSKLTLEAYHTDLEQFTTYIQTTYPGTPLLELHHSQIRSWLAELKLNKCSARTINRKLSSLNSFYKYYFRQGAIQGNPLKALHAQKLPERLPVFLKENETQVLLNNTTFDESFVGLTEQLICELLYSTGMRRMELCNLKEKDIEWGLGQIRILGKGNKERLVPVSQELLTLITNYINVKHGQEKFNAEYLLNTDSGEKVYEMMVYRTVKKYMSEVTTLGKKSPHVLRHTFATHLLNNGANIQAIKDLLGHSSLAATQIYTHNNIEQLKELHKKIHPRG